MASRGPYWYVTVSLLQYIGKPFQARTGVFFDKSLQACRITLFSCSPWPWSRLPSRLRDRIRQESVIKYHGKGHLSRKILILLRFFLRTSAPLCWLMEYSFRKKKLPARWLKGSFFRLLSRAFLLICQYWKSQFVHHKLIFDWWKCYGDQKLRVPLPSPSLFPWQARRPAYPADTPPKCEIWIPANETKSGFLPEPVYMLINTVTNGHTGGIED